MSEFESNGVNPESSSTGDNLSLPSAATGTRSFDASLAGILFVVAGILHLLLVTLLDVDRAIYLTPLQCFLTAKGLGVQILFLFGWLVSLSPKGRRIGGGLIATAGAIWLFRNSPERLVSLLKNLTVVGMGLGLVFQGRTVWRIAAAIAGAVSGYWAWGLRHELIQFAKCYVLPSHDLLNRWISAFHDGSWYRYPDVSLGSLGIVNILFLLGYLLLAISSCRRLFPLRESSNGEAPQPIAAGETLAETGVVAPSSPDANDPVSATLTESPSKTPSGEVLSPARSIGLGLVWSALSLGIYHIVWLCSVTTEINRANGHPERLRGSVNFLLVLLTCGIWFPIWAYHLGDGVDEACRVRGLMQGNRGSIFLLLSLFGFGWVVPVLAQEELNLFAATDPLRPSTAMAGR